MVYMTGPQMSERLLRLYRKVSGEHMIIQVRLVRRRKFKNIVISESEKDHIKIAVELIAWAWNNPYLFDLLFTIMDLNTLFLLDHTIRSSARQLADQFATVKCDCPKKDVDFFQTYSCFSLNT